MYSHDGYAVGGVWGGCVGAWLGVAAVAVADGATADGDFWHSATVEHRGECAVAMVVAGVAREWGECRTDVVPPLLADGTSGRVCMSDEVLEYIAAGARG